MCLFELWFSQGICRVGRLLGLMVGLFLVFKSVSILFSIVAVLIYIPINSARGFPLLYTLSSIYCVYFFFLMMAILTCEMIPHCSFDLPSPVKVKLLNHVRLFATLWTVACKTPPSGRIFQARILEWVSISFSRWSSRPRDPTRVSCTADRLFTVWPTEESSCGPVW